MNLPAGTPDQSGDRSDGELITKIERHHIQKNLRKSQKVGTPTMPMILIV